MNDLLNDNRSGHQRSRMTRLIIIKAGRFLEHTNQIQLVILEFGDLVPESFNHTHYMQM